jgi:exodeoxyribonuclease VII large subunit
MTISGQSSGPSSGTTRPTLSVSELNRQIKRMLEVSYAQVWVSGELSSFSRPSSGHWYFTLKDQKAQVRCAMFRGANQRLRFQPKEGDEIIVRAKVSLYEGRGDYQLIVEGMEPAGIGQLQAAFEALKLKLLQEGLFDAAHKKSIPSIPSRVCVITSRSGAVIHDIINVTKRRFPALEIILIPVSVQGQGAAEEIAQAIEIANRLEIADVLIVSRGGGSLEDLWAFNEERVARAIYASELPIISAVGHEVDVSIADMVADLRAPTPSAAAEYVTPDQFELTQKLDDMHRRLRFLMRHKIEQSRRHVDHISQRLQHPGNSLKEKANRADLLSRALRQLLLSRLSSFRQSVQTDAARLNVHNPERLLQSQSQRCSDSFNELRHIAERILSQHTHRFGMAAQSLHVVSPLATLDRGYSILKDGKKVVRSTKEVSPGQSLRATLPDGELALKVTSVESDAL